MAESEKKGGRPILNPEMDRRRFLLISGTLAAGATIGKLVKPASAAAPVAGRSLPDFIEVDAGVQVIMSACQNCHSRCGIMARVKDGVLLKIDGNPYHPNNFDPDERPSYSTPVEEAKKKPGRLCA